MLVTNAVPGGEDEFRAEINALFEASDRDGQVLWDPQLDPGEPSPGAVVFIEDTCRLAVKFVQSICSIEDGRWKAKDSAGGVPIETPLETAWRAAAAVRDAIKQRTGIGAYIIPVVVFVNMTESADILAARGRRKVRILWGTKDLLERLASLPEEHELQPQLNSDLVADEVAALSQPPPDSGSTVAPASPAPQPAVESDISGLDLGSRPVIMQHVDTIHINIVVQGNGGGGESPPFNLAD